MEIVLIAAIAENGVIGRAGGLPWRIKSDMQRFPALTLGQARWWSDARHIFRLPGGRCRGAPTSSSADRAILPRRAQSSRPASTPALRLRAAMRCDAAPMPSPWSAAPTSMYRQCPWRDRPGDPLHPRRLRRRCIFFRPSIRREWREAWCGLPTAPGPDDGRRLRCCDVSARGGHQALRDRPGQRSQVGGVGPKWPLPDLWRANRRSTGLPKEGRVHAVE